MERVVGKENKSSGDRPCPFFRLGWPYFFLGLALAVVFYFLFFFILFLFVLSFLGRRGAGTSMGRPVTCLLSGGGDAPSAGLEGVWKVRWKAWKAGKEWKERTLLAEQAGKVRLKRR